MRRFCPNRFEDKMIIPTGTARGIGEATAIRAAKEEVKLVLANRLREEGERVLNAVRTEGGTAVFLDLNLSAKEHTKQMVDAAVKTCGHLGITINNVGVTGNPDPLHELEQERIDYIMANNFYPVFFCYKHEVREFMKEGSGGVTISNASITGPTGLPGNPAYVASKHAVNRLTKNLALDYARYGIRINPVNPAGTITPMIVEAYEYVKNHREAAAKAGMGPAGAQFMAGQKLTSMLEREAATEEQAASILFLVSDNTIHMTGATVQTNRGWTSF